MVSEKNFTRIIVIGFIIVLGLLSFLIIRPIVLSIIAGLFLAYIFYPFFIRLSKFIKEKNISALIIILLIVFVIFIPLRFLFPTITRQVFQAYTFTQQINIGGLLEGILPETLSTDTIANVNNFISKIMNTVFSKLSDLLLNLPAVFLQVAVTLFVFFFAMRDGEKLKEHVKSLSPFSPDIEKSLETQFRGITNSVVYGQIVVGIIQGVLTGVGLFIFGIPNALVLTIIAVLLSILPIVGAYLIWAPAAIYLLLSGNFWQAAGLALYGGVIVSWIDNILKPYIVSKRTKIPSVLVLLGMIGGLIVFGIIGLILGPLILAYLLVIIEAYKGKKLSTFFQKEGAEKKK